MGPGLRGQGDKVLVTILTGLLLDHILSLLPLSNLRGFEDVDLPVTVSVVLSELCAQHGVEAVHALTGAPSLQLPPWRCRSQEVRGRQGWRGRGTLAQRHGLPINCLDAIYKISCVN